MTESLTLTKFDSPYRIASNVLVTEHVTLTVQPSVELRFSPGVMLAINGTLIAEVSTDCHNTVIIRIILVCTASLQIANTIDYTGVYSPPHTRADLEFLSGGGGGWVGGGGGAVGWGGGRGGVGEGEGGRFLLSARCHNMAPRDRMLIFSQRLCHLHPVEL